jgi:hypothetical protein
MVFIVGVRMKKALALIAYDRADYLSKVLASLYQQSIASSSLFDIYDIFLFQDGLKESHKKNPEFIAEHARVTELIGQAKFVKQTYLQAENLGVARHFDFVERTLFADQSYDFVVFCEDDMILGPAYMNTLDQMANLFAKDSRVGMVSAHSQNYVISKERQFARQNEYLAMGHNWGFGLYRRAWTDIYPLITHYLELIANLPYGQRNHRVIQYWQEQCGFRAGATSQDYIKACALAALGYLRVSSYPNYGFYIGAKGEHYYPEAYAQQKYDETVMLDESPQTLSAIDEATYKSILAQHHKVCLKDQWTLEKQNLFREKLEAGAFEPNIPSNMWAQGLTAEDVVAAYKIFFNRTPDNRQVVEGWIGKDASLLLRAILNSDEFKRLLNPKASSN